MKEVSHNITAEITRRGVGQGLELRRWAPEALEWTASESENERNTTDACRPRLSRDVPAEMGELDRFRQRASLLATLSWRRLCDTGAGG